MNNKVMLKIKLVISLALLLNWMAIIYYLSSQVAKESTVHSQGLAISITSLVGIEISSESSLLFYEGIIRETAHGIEFAILSLFAYFSLKYLILLINKDCLNKPWLIEKVVLIFSFIYAFSDEIHQLFVPGRAFEIMDLAIDLAGIIVGIFAAKLIFYLSHRSQCKDKEDFV